MKRSWDYWSELRDLDPARRRAAWEAGFGAVSGRPVFLATLACAAVCTTAGIAAGVLLWPVWPGRILGAIVGAIGGQFVYEKILRHLMRPHVLRYLRDHRP